MNCIAKRSTTATADASVVVCLCLKRCSQLVVFRLAHVMNCQRQNLLVWSTHTFGLTLCTVIYHAISPPQGYPGANPLPPGHAREQPQFGGYPYGDYIQGYPQGGYLPAAGERRGERGGEGMEGGGGDGREGKGREGRGWEGGVGRGGRGWGERRGVINC